MTIFTITITDPAQLAGIAWAREQSNAARDPEDQFADDRDYLEWIIVQAAVSYARDQHAAASIDALKAAEAGDLTKLDALRAEYAARGGRAVAAR